MLRTATAIAMAIGVGAIVSYLPENERVNGASALDNPSLPPSISSAPSIFTAVQEQLGLKLEPTRGPVDVLVIDRVERPAEN